VRGHRPGPNVKARISIVAYNGFSKEEEKKTPLGCRAKKLWKGFSFTNTGEKRGKSTSGKSTKGKKEKNEWVARKIPIAMPSGIHKKVFDREKRPALPPIKEGPLSALREGRRANLWLRGMYYRSEGKYSGPLH